MIFQGSTAMCLQMNRIHLRITTFSNHRPPTTMTMMITLLNAMEEHYRQHKTETQRFMKEEREKYIIVRIIVRDTVNFSLHEQMGDC